MDTRRFDLPAVATLRLQTRSGKITVTAEPRDDVLVESDGFDERFDETGATLEIRSGRGGSKSLAVRCPAGTDIVIGTHSGDVLMSGDFGIVSVTTMSGKIDLEAADEADLRTGSGNISLGRSRGRCRMNSMSGTVNAGDCGAASAGTMSGNIRIGHVAGSFKARSVSGTIEATCDGDGSIAIKTVSGRVHIALPSGTALQTRFKTMSGHVRNPFPPGSDCLVEAMSISGSIDLVPA